MIKNKRGLSTVVTTLIIILLVLVAIGIIWIVVRNVLESGSNEIDFRTKCLDVDVKATAVTCLTDVDNWAVCNVSLERTRGSDEIAGVKLVFHNSTTDEGSLSPEEYSQNIGLLSTATKTNANTTIRFGTDSVDVVPFFETAEGDDYICATSSTYTY